MKILESHIVPAISEKIRLQEYAVSIFTSIQTRSSLKKAIKKRLVLINGEKAQTSDWIKPGQKIDLLKPFAETKKVFKLNFEVLFEDEHIAVVHKPPGFPTSGNYFKTIENALPHNLSSSSEIDTLPYPLPAHRLDNPTSGILLCAKTNSSLIKLQEAFAQKQIQKTYYAIVSGEIKEKIEIDSPIDQKISKTILIPIEFYQIENKNYTLVELNPLTGRTHQLRIHLSENNTPIIGDNLYGKEETNLLKNKSIYLFAGKISFDHPLSKKLMTFQLQLPKKFRNLGYYRAH
ncbi:RluA family pseudouridine synthase [Christiangramia forsetii]|uniref:RNA pseudouridylate synthase n=2 Tax=Christiangramia forsetii TaxID=411153 RepID=A0LXI9_CHRFK|nr:RluA family pseudouridine synthase [Christiangramia forsetii]GGG36700.1 pseudouridine synthase [Christiangramia forsetii]CAL65084.1 RNA pseudouridylate synthase [Christiangramia forsetii KT0803]